MTTFKMNLSILAVFTIVILSSCNDDNNDIQKEISFTEFSMEIRESLSATYPTDDLIMSVSRNDNGSEQTIFGLKGEIKKAAQLGLFAARNANDGTECNGTVSCGKAIKKCLDNGQDAVISNDNCATYCVTCQEPQL